MTEKYRRSIIFSYDDKVKGSYSFQDKFQLLPVPNQFPNLNRIEGRQTGGGHNPCILEIKYSNSDNIIKNLPNGAQDEDDYNKHKKEILLLLSVFSRTYFFDYYNKRKNAWFITINHQGDSVFDNLNLYWGQELYFAEKFNPNINSLSNQENNVEKIYFVKANKYYKPFSPDIDYTKMPPNSTMDCFLPDITDKLFSSYYLLEATKQNKYLNACNLFNQGVELKENYKSLSFVAFISAIETLINFENKDKKVKCCKECNQRLFKVTDKFKNFLAEYGFGSLTYKKLAAELYQLRSKIVHSGKLLIGDEQRLFSNSQQRFEGMLTLEKIEWISKVCMVNWLLKNSNK